MTDLEACQQLLLRLQHREPVAAHELKRALGEEHWEDYERRLKRVKEWREEATIASYELRDYVRMLRIADLHDAQPNQISGHMRKRRLRWTSPSTKYERALEHLSERIQENVSLADHLDRAFSPYSWDSSTDIGPDKEGVPRLWYTENALPRGEQDQDESAAQDGSVGKSYRSAVKASGGYEEAQAETLPPSQAPQNQLIVYNWTNPLSQNGHRLLRMSAMGGKRSFPNVVSSVVKTCGALRPIRRCPS